MIHLLTKTGYIDCLECYAYADMPTKEGIEASSQYSQVTCIPCLRALIQKIEELVTRRSLTLIIMSPS